jgi:hypothetical protein
VLFGQIVNEVLLFAGLLPSLPPYAWSASGAGPEKAELVQISQTGVPKASGVSAQHCHEFAVLL